VALTSLGLGRSVVGFGVLVAGGEVEGPSMIAIAGPGVNEGPAGSVSVTDLTRWLVSGVAVGNGTSTAGATALSFGAF
jgi:hypothetical protein